MINLITSLLSLRFKSSILSLHPPVSGRLHDAGRLGLTLGVCNPSIARAFAGMYDMFGDSGDCVPMEGNGEEPDEGGGRGIVEM